MEQPGRVFLARARSPGAEDGLAGFDDLALHEQIAERRMQRIGGGRRQHHFGVAGDFDAARRVAPVGDADPAQFDVVLRRDDDIGVGLEIEIIAPVMPAEFGAAFREDRFVMRGAAQRRLMRGGPGRAAGDVFQVNEIAPGIAHAVFPPARHRQVVPAAVAAAGMGQHDVIAAIRQQLHFRRRRIRVAQYADRHFRAAGAGLDAGQFGGMGIQQ